MFTSGILGLCTNGTQLRSISEAATQGAWPFQETICREIWAEGACRTRAVPRLLAALVHEGCGPVSSRAPPIAQST